MTASNIATDAIGATRSAEHGVPALAGRTLTRWLAEDLPSVQDAGPVEGARSAS